MQRRRFVQTGITVVSGLIMANQQGILPRSPFGGSGSAAESTWRMPEEGEPHRRTWMAFGATAENYDDVLPEARRNLATIARTIAAFEPVSMLVRPAELTIARELIGDANVELVPAEIDDLWMRDTGPVFVSDGGRRAGVDFNFNGWGGKQEHGFDAAVAEIVTRAAGVERVRTDLVLEGGGIEVDGEGTAVITESCVLNANRNPGWSKSDVEAELDRLLGLRKIIWLPGIAGRDITDGHTDFYARFVRPGVVVAALDTNPESYDHEVTKRHLEILKTATDAHGRTVQVEVIKAPTRVRPEYKSADFAAGYINFYVCNGAVIAPEFGDAEADSAAFTTLARLFPNRRIVQIDIDAIAWGGGGIHCTTQQEPA
ncbi:agmatine deiminase family protein [Nocardia sp. NPDC005978]|uniref:agmatine deiminase family protein n=1 Tax=Nocardia sp. NPDC005978 TaxID=3156725 RepID=UPI0033BEB3FB